MFSSGLKSEIWRLVFILIACAVTGGLSGYFLLFMTAGLTACLLRLLFKIHQLLNWTRRTRLTRVSTQAPVSNLWRDAVYDIEWLLSRHEKEKERLTTLVNRVQQMATALQDAVILVDAKGNMEWWNQAAERLFDFQDSDAGHKLTNLIRHPDFIQYFEQRDYDVPLALTLTRKQFLTLAGGYLFGVWLGGAATVVGATVGAVLVFYAVRTSLGDALRRRAEASGGKLKAAIDGVAAGAFGYILTLRLIPLAPFWLVNVAAALAHAPLGAYALATFIGIMPATFIYSGIGAGIGDLLARGETPDLGVIFDPKVLAPLVALGLLTLATTLYQRHRARSGKRL